jgi:phosphoglycolate phosphatase-like HAD superfamily hydrolase
MRPRILLFDIDGTLIRSGGAGARALERAVATAFGLGAVKAGFSFAGGTDPAIFRRLLTESGVEPTDDALARTFDVYLDILREEIGRAEGYRVNPGMEDALETLAAQGPEAVAVGLGTGNIEAGARIKLARADLNRHFPFGGFGSDAEDRAGLLAAGAARGAARLGCELAACDVLVIGDTPLDVAAAHAIGARCVGVATGGATRPELAAAGADWLFGSLAESGAIDALLDG